MRWVDILLTRKLLFLCAIVWFFILLSFTILSVSSSSNQEGALSEILEAEQAMAQAYEAVLDAERVGAKVSGLLARLNDAAGMLSEGQMAFGVGDFERAIRFAELSNEVGWEVVGNAEGLEVEAKNEHANRVRWFLTGSVAGVTLVFVAGFLGYGYFKRRYYRGISKKSSKAGQV